MYIHVHDNGMQSTTYTCARKACLTLTQVAKYSAVDLSPFYNFDLQLYKGLSLKLATQFESTEQFSSDKLRASVVVFVSVLSTLRPTVVSADRISERALTVDHTLLSDLTVGH